LVPAQTALAHALDAYLHASYITLKPTQVVVELNLTPGLLVAPQVLPKLDTNTDQQISEAESQAYVNSLLRNVLLQVDGQPSALAVTKIEMPPYLNIQAGYGNIRVFAAAALADGMTGAHQLAYKNNNAPVGAVYQVNAFVDKGANITLGQQNRDPNQQSMTMEFTVGSAAPATGVPTESTATSEQARQLLAFLYQPALSPWVLLMALGLALVLGGLHALTPGHGKALVAAYLVGSRGTVGHAALLGAIVTITHTASVIIIGLLALFASQFVVPNVLIPILEMLSGLLVVLMGAQLIWQRWTALRNPPPSDHTHTGTHAHPFAHDHGDGRSHSHWPASGNIKPGSLMAMGISGGLVPCPEALGIMVIAIGINRIALGLGLIVSFSLGLAAVLIIIGILLVRSRSLVERFAGVGDRWGRALPLASAIIVTALGLAITLRGLVSFQG
jgi:ABC-type nickel/cobalt efflux system permease component RcnA